MPTILIVDDEPANLQVLTQLLRPSYRVRAANSGKNALLSVAAEVPDLILLDVMMPDIDGYEVLKRLRENIATRDIPVIFVTALSDASDEEKGLELGAADYITKPLKPVVVLARVKTQLEAQQAREFLRVNRPGTRRHLRASNLRPNRRCHESKAISRRIQDRSGPPDC